MNRKVKNKMQLGVTIGFALGAITGVIIGIVSKEIALWLSIGIGVGIALGVSIGTYLEYLKTNSMQTKIVVGYIIGVIGLIIIGWTAFVYLTNFEFIKLQPGVGLFLCIIGAVMIKKAKNK